ncbi:MAG: lysophospholipase [Candidatus Obscuribacterales bacterium]|nr:lysophospholipase [Candidatus Obscuribacterales bacterium]
MIARILIAVLAVFVLHSTSAKAEGSAEPRGGFEQGSIHPALHGDEAEATGKKQSRLKAGKIATKGDTGSGHHRPKSGDTDIVSNPAEKPAERTLHEHATSKTERESSAEEIVRSSADGIKTDENRRPLAGDDRPATVERSSSSKNRANAQEEKESSKKPKVVRAKGSEKDPPHAYRGVAPCLAWVDRTKPINAVLVCVHGLGLHNGTYEAFGKRMSELGYATYAIDVRGFGAWMQAKGRERVDFEHCINDVRTTLKVVRRAHPNCPVFLLGESMGGAIALRVTSMYPELVDGLISSVPAADRFKHAKTSIKVGFHLLKNADKPINMGEGVVKQATKNPELRKSWLEDPLAKLKLSARELLQFQSFMNGNQDCAKNIRSTAVLIVQGCQDKLVRPEGTVELFNHLATNDREIVLIPGAEHLIFEEAQFTDKEIATVDSWIAAHLHKPSTPGEGSGEEKKAEPTEAVKGDLE